MPENEKFYTFKGYSLLDDSAITASMEDYLEMIYRIHSNKEVVRVGVLANNLNIKPSSATKMMVNLKNQGLISTEKYGCIKMTQAGKELGEYLIFRHNILNNFLCYINQSDNELEQVEKIEHFINKNTIFNIEKLLEKLVELEINKI